jgi:DNA-binding Xre family transcriptional regulator
MSYTKYEDLLAQELKDPEFKREYEALEDEFTLAREIVALRKDRHLTQKELAERIGTSQPAIARLESGNYKNLSLSFLRRVAKALNAVPEVHLRPERET